MKTDANESGHENWTYILYSVSNVESKYEYPVPLLRDSDNGVLILVKVVVVGGRGRGLGGVDTGQFYPSLRVIYH